MSESVLGDLGGEPHLLSGTNICHIKNHVVLRLARFSWDKITLPRSGNIRGPS